jgi:hypothetical protein
MGAAAALSKSFKSVTVVEKVCLGSQLLFSSSCASFLLFSFGPYCLISSRALDRLNFSGLRCD